MLANWTGSSDPGVGGRNLGMGDCDRDSDIDSADLLSLLAQWTGAPASVLAAVPEPNSLLLGALATMRLLLRRRRPTAVTSIQICSVDV
jgi:hypothetical protein